MPTETRGGTYSPADIPLIRKALEVYLQKCLDYERSEGGPHEDTRSIINLQHRLKRIRKEN